MQRLILAVSFSCLTSVAPAQVWVESGDAGPLPAFAQPTVGSGPITAIDGSLAFDGDIDMFLIRVTDYVNFSATTVGGSTTDTELWLFRTDGVGIAHNDDDPGGGTTRSTLTDAFLTGNGLVYLAVAEYRTTARDASDEDLWDRPSATVEHAPDGLGAANPLSYWAPEIDESPGDYVVTLTGAEFAQAGTPASRRLGPAGRQAGSVLIFPVHRSGDPWITILNVSNTATEPDGPTTFGGSTNAHFEYVNVTPNPTAHVNPLAKFMPAGCTIFDRVEFLTPADHISVLTTCHNAFAGDGQEGYVVVSAENPALPMGRAWLHNHLIGSETVMSARGVTYIVNAIAIRGRGGRVLTPDGGEPVDFRHTDLTSGVFPYTLEFDGENFDPLPDCLMSDFLGVGESQLALINFTGGPNIENTLYFEVYNDNELPLSATLRFRCWFDQPLSCVNPLFSESMLDSFPNDPEELDITCDGVGDLETGWFKIRSTGTWYPGGTRHSDDGAVHGSITAGHASVRGGHLLWEEGVQFNGAFRTP